MNDEYAEIAVSNLHYFRTFNPKKKIAPFGRDRLWGTLTQPHYGVYVIVILDTGRMLVGAGEQVYLAARTQLSLLETGKHRSEVLQKAFLQGCAIECAVLETSTRNKALMLKHHIVQYLDSLDAGFILNYNPVRDRNPQPPTSLATKEKLRVKIMELEAMQRRLIKRVEKLEQLAGVARHEETAVEEQENEEPKTSDEEKLQSLRQLATAIRSVALTRIETGVVVLSREQNRMVQLQKAQAEARERHNHLLDRLEMIAGNIPWYREFLEQQLSKPYTRLRLVKSLVARLGDNFTHKDLITLSYKKVLLMMERDIAEDTLSKASVSERSKHIVAKAKTLSEAEKQAIPRRRPYQVKR